MLKVICDFGDYKPWQGAIDTYDIIERAGKLEELEDYLEECFPDGIRDVEINDILWFEGDEVLAALGLAEEEDEDDE